MLSFIMVYADSFGVDDDRKLFQSVDLFILFTELERLNIMVKLNTFSGCLVSVRDHPLFSNRLNYIISPESQKTDGAATCFWHHNWPVDMGLTGA